MAVYVDGFVLPVPKAKVDAYKKMARLAAKVWMDHGALEFRECMADDLSTPMGASFAKTAKLKEGETVFFSYIVFKSRRHRDQVNKKVMADERLSGMDPKSMPFDVKRMSYGGFQSVVEG